MLGADLFVLAPLEFRSPPPRPLAALLCTRSEGDNSVLILWGIFFVEENDRSRGFSGMIHSFTQSSVLRLTKPMTIYLYLSISGS